MKTVLLLLFISPIVAWAQVFKITPQDAQRRQSFLLMRDGSVVRGQILRQDSTIISVRKRGGNLSFIEADQVISVLADRSGLPENKAGVRPASPYKVYVMKDGARIEGMFIRRDSTMITLQKPNGQFTYFEPELLARIDTVQGESFRDGGRTFPNRFAPYLLTGLTAHNPEKGRFYYRNTWLLLNELQYGITRNWSVGASFITPIPYLAYSDLYFRSGEYLSYNSRLFTKISVPIGNRFRLGVDASYRNNQQFTLIRGRDIWTFQALATVGSSQRNATLGYGLITPSRRRYEYYTYSFSSSYPPQPGSGQFVTYTIPNQSFLTLGLVQKVSPGLTIVLDNTLLLGRTYYQYNESKASLSAALRLDRRRHAFDLGIYTLIYQKPILWENGRSTRFFPYVGYNLLIGRD
ncbi:hypothetical protein [Spirosoma arcticum]